MNADVLTIRAADGITVITPGSAKRIYFEEAGITSPSRSIVVEPGGVAHD